MPQTSYLQRVRAALSTLAKDDQKTIILTDFMDHIKGTILLEGKRAGPRAECFIRKALQRERLAARVKLVRDTSDVKIVLSPSGYTYFQNYGALRVINHRGRQFEKLTIAQLCKETNTLKTILEQLLEGIRANDNRFCEVPSITELPSVVSKIIERVKALGEQNTELTSILAEQRGMERALQKNERRALVSSSAY